MATTKKAKSECAVKLGSKGGKASKAKKVGIFSASYKKKVSAKKAATRVKNKVQASQKSKRKKK